MDRLAAEFARKTDAHRRNTRWLWATLAAIVISSGLVIGLMAWGTVTTNRRIERSIQENEARITASEQALCEVVLPIQRTPKDPPPRDARAARVQTAFKRLVIKYRCH